MLTSNVVIMTTINVAITINNDRYRKIMGGGTGDVRSWVLVSVNTAGVRYGIRDWDDTRARLGTVAPIANSKLHEIALGARCRRTDFALRGISPPSPLV